MGAIQEYWQTTLDFLQPYPYLQALLIIFVFLVLAFLVDRVISGVVSRVVSRTQTQLDDRLVAIMHRPIFTTVALMGLILATYQLDINYLVLLGTIGIIKTLLVLIWLTFGLRLSGMMLSAMKRREDRFQFVQQTTEPLLKNALAVLLFVAAAYTILMAWDVNVTGLVASAGILGLALSFAAQDTLANLFAGVAILADRPYQIGDYVIIDSGERGQVTQIGLRSTRLLTRDDVEVSIPNSVMGNAKIVNEAGGPPQRYRIRASVGVAYGSDIDEVMKVLVGVASEHPKVHENPEPRARFRTFGESSLDFDLLCWIQRPADRGLVVHELNCAIYKKFDAEGIAIPFPKRDLYIKEMPQR
jgi:small-conductance mechanosensitive channel